MTAWQWYEIATAEIATVGPNYNPGAALNGGSKRNRVDAWNGIAVVDSSVYMAGVGGHADYGGNEGYGCNLAAEAPVWVMLNQPTPDAQIALNASHYADGRPTSSHTYYALHGDWKRKKIFRMGTGVTYGNGNWSFANVDAFDIAARDWDRASQWPSVPEQPSYGNAQVQHPDTGDIYVVGNTRLWRFSQSEGAWLQLAAIPQNGTAAYGRATVVDSRRNRLVVLGNAYRTPVGILIYDLLNNRWDDSAFMTGADASKVGSYLGNCGHHNLAIDKYIIKTDNAGEVLTVDPNNYSVGRLTTIGGDSIPAAVNRVWGKFAAIPALGGYVYQPSGVDKLWFLAGPN